MIIFKFFQVQKSTPGNKQKAEAEVLEWLATEASLVAAYAAR